jgi:integrase
VRLVAVEPDRYEEWRATLLAAIREEFHSEVIYCSELRGVLAVPDCTVPGSIGSELNSGLCIGHWHRWRTAGKPVGAEKHGWVAHQPALLKGRNTPEKCLVPNCRQGRESTFCTKHRTLWRGLVDRPQAHAWANSLAAAAASHRTSPCPVAVCDLDVRPSEPLCAAHLLRWKRNGQPRLDEFVRSLDDSGRTRYDLRILPGILRLEVQYLLQAVHDRNTSRLTPNMFKELLRILRRSQLESLTEVPRDRWKSWWAEHATSRGLGCVGLLRFASDALNDLIEGVGWESEYPRSVWDRRRLGFSGTVRRLDFRSIEQPMLNDLVKRWCRQRLLSERSTFDGVAKDLLAVRSLSGLFARRRTNTDLDRLDRQFLEEWMSDIAGLINRRTGAPISRSHRKAMLSAISVLLNDNRRHGWYPQVPVNAQIHSDDHPRPEERLPRAIPESAMQVIEAPGSIEMLPRADYRLIARLHIETGLRNVDIRNLVHGRFLSRDAQGHPYLLWYNHKLRRDAATPVNESLAADLSDHARTVAMRYPNKIDEESKRPPANVATALKLFPTTVGNPTGTTPVSYVGFNQGLQRWFDTLRLVDEIGRPIHVTCHQFRHTYGTRLINSDVPQHIVQALLDHTSPTMTAHYARLNDKTIRAAWEAATGHRESPPVSESVIDPTGRLSDAQWNRHRLEQASALRLANGYCGMSPNKVCEHANPCLRCDLFLPDIEFLDDYRRQLAVTKDVAHRAREEGYVRLAEKADQDATALLSIIRRVSGEPAATAVPIALSPTRRMDHAS